jgi:hypothetical protein
VDIPIFPKTIFDAVWVWESWNHLRVCDEVWQILWANEECPPESLALASSKRSSPHCEC